MFILTLSHFIVLAMRGGTLSYYFQYYVDQDRLFDFLGTVGLTNVAGSGGVWHYLLNTFGLVVDAQQTNVSSVGFSLFNMSSQFVTVLGVLCFHRLSMKFGKKAVAIWRLLAHHHFHGAVLPAARGRHRRHVPHGIWPRPHLRADHPADLGDVRRRGRLCRMEDRPPHHRRDLRHDPVRPQDRAEPGRRHGRLAALRPTAIGPMRCRRRVRCWASA